MCNRSPLATEDCELEARLRRLLPRPPSLQRDTLMFEAGRQAARRQVRRWQAASVALCLGAVLLGTLERTAPPATESQAHARPPWTPAAIPTPPAPVQVALSPHAPSNLDGAREYLRWRSRLITEGIDALPNPPSCSALPEATEPWARWSLRLPPGPSLRRPRRPPQPPPNRL